MGSLRKKTFTKPLPANAELYKSGGQQFVRWVERTRKLKALPKSAEVFEKHGELLAKWVDKAGKEHTAPVEVDHKGSRKIRVEKTRTAKVTTGRNDSLRIVIQSGVWLAKFRDGSGNTHEVSTGCRDRAAAQTKLTELERRAELVRSGVITESQDAIAGHLTTPLAKHFESYLTHLKGHSDSKKHRKNVRSCLERLAAECSFRKLADISVPRLEQWLLDAEDIDLGPRTRNRYRSAIVAFCGWCVTSERMLKNSLTSLPVANEKADRRRLRRALEVTEIGKLLDTAERRPLLEALTIRRGKNRGKPLANVKPDVRKKLLRLGRERRLIYLVLLSTGLRKDELKSILIHQVNLDARNPGIDLLADNEKNGEGSFIPLRADVAAELRIWRDERQRELLDRDRLKFNAEPEASLSGQPLFRVPDALDKIFNKDIELAGIAKRDERGRVVDVHALRTTFCSMLQKAGVAPRVAQEAMRHSDIRLTMATYTDPKLLDIAGAIESLPTITASFERPDDAVVMTGTDTDSGHKGEAQGEASTRLSVIPCATITSDSTTEASQASGEGSIPFTRFSS